MEDRREQILDRIFEILNDKTTPVIKDAKTVARNRGLFDNDMRPTLLLLDGDETTRLGGDRRGRVGMSTGLVTMTPQIFIVLKSKKPQNEDVGQTLNSYRTAILAALARDATLKALVGPNGNIGYEGAETDLKNGMLLEGQMQLSLSITTAFLPYG